MVIGALLLFSTLVSPGDGGWASYASQKGGFRVDFPSQPQQLPDSDEPGFTGAGFAAKCPDGATFVFYADSAKMPAKFDRDKVLDSAVGGYMQGHHMLKQEKATYAGVPARHVVGTDDDSATEGYAFMKGRRTFLVLAMSRTVDGLKAASFKRFFGSFSFLAQK